MIPGRVAGPGYPAVRRDSAPLYRIENRTGYDDEDLERLVVAAMRGEGLSGPLDFLFVAAPARSRGCAEIGVASVGRKIVIALASPARFRLLRLANLLRHELRHIVGEDHDEMESKVEWALGPMPEWAKQFLWRPIRYHGRAPNQFLSRPPAGLGRFVGDSSRGSTRDAGYGTIFETTRK